MNPDVSAFFDEATFTVTYVVTDPGTKQCAVIDPVLDYDPASGKSSTEAADRVIRFVESSGLTVTWILETHLHADHLTAAQYVKKILGGKVCIGSDIGTIQNVFNRVFNLKDVPADGSQFDELLGNGAEITLGSIAGYVIHTPGHTPACNSYVFGDACFVGDTLFMPDFGTARCDFPGGDAATLYDSIHKLFSLPEQTRMFMCHDYKAPGRDEFAWESTVVEQRESNINVHVGITKEEFVTYRTARDTNLNAPRLIMPSIQVNIRAGQFPPAEDNDVSYLKIPLST